MKYLVIDASLNGTGIRDKYAGGYLSLNNLGLNTNTLDQFNKWLLKYENEYYNGFFDNNIIDELDKEGKEIALMIKNELSDVKLEYFSDAKMTTEII